MVIALLAAVAAAQSAPAKARPSHRAQASAFCAACVRANLSYLAGPALHGRGSGTPDEMRAAQYIAGKMKQYGLRPAAEDGKYIQVGILKTRTVTAPPLLAFEGAGAKPVQWEHGDQMAIVHLMAPQISAQLQKMDLTTGGASPAAVRPDVALLVKTKPWRTMSEAQAIVGPYMSGNAAILLLEAPEDDPKLFDSRASQLPRLPREVGDDQQRSFASVILLKKEAYEQLWAASDGTLLKLHADVSPWKVAHTWNVLAKLEGTTEKEQIMLLSAHLDHLGVRDGKTYPGADDDASGTVAVMELARALSREKAPRRTVVFALWGSEEIGMVGARYFLDHPTFELKDIVANLEFEMIGRADPKVKPEELWLTGWERTDLGPELAANGANLVGDPHPDQHFFQRSDNYALAMKGIVAQTVSSFGLHKDYHQPTDTLAKIDWRHLDGAIASMIAPVTWLANSDFVPQWKEGQKP
jgi:hypothetical protein